MKFKSLLINIINNRMNNLYRFSVIGLRVEKILLNKCVGGDYFVKYQEQGDKHIFLLKNMNGDLFELGMYEDESSSGRNVLRWGMIAMKSVKKFGEKTHIPIEEGKTIDFDYAKITGDEQINSFEVVCSVDDFTFNNDLFKFSHNGGNDCYPCGHVVVNLEEFEHTRVVWIFHGETHLSSNLSDLESYETDMSEDLPDNITQSIIVIGNKYNHSLKTIINKIHDVDNCEIIDVNFNKYK